MESIYFLHYLVVKFRKIFKLHSPYIASWGQAMNFSRFLMIVSVFLAGFLASQAYSVFSAPTPSNDGFELPADVYAGVTGSAIPRIVPGDHIQEPQIRVYKDRVVLDIQDAIWAQFTPTHSMDPVLSDTANAIEIVPKSADQVDEGDIVAYKSEYADGIIIHRVIKKGEDQLGAYYIVKGDNNPKADPGLVRFEDIKSVVVGIIY
jgi:hypothetical protein